MNSISEADLVLNSTSETYFVVVNCSSPRILVQFSFIIPRILSKPHWELRELRLAEWRSLYKPSSFIRKSDPIRSYLCSGGLIWGASHNILKFNYLNYSCLDLYQKRCVLYKLFISLRCMNESPRVGCVSTGSRRCVYKSFSLSRFKVCSLKIGVLNWCWCWAVDVLLLSSWWCAIGFGGILSHPPNPIATTLMLLYHCCWIILLDCCFVQYSVGLLLNYSVGLLFCQMALPIMLDSPLNRLISCWYFWCAIRLVFLHQECCWIVVVKLLKNCCSWMDDI